MNAYYGSKPIFAVTPDPTENIYSTEEIRIGTWMGKPLYRKCKYIGSPTLNIGGWSKIDDAPENVDMVLDIRGGFVYYGQIFPIPVHLGSENYVAISIQPNNSVSISIESSIFPGHVNKMFYIIEYTKTTD